MLFPYVSQPPYEISLFAQKILKLFKFLKGMIMVSPTCCEIKGGLQLNSVVAADGPVCAELCSCIFSLLDF